MRWLVVLLVVPLAGAEVVQEDPIDDQDAPHPALLKEFDIAEVRVTSATTDEQGFDGVFVGVGYDCPLTHSMPATNRTTRFTFTLGNETVQQGVWVQTLDGCSRGQSTGIPLREGCLITDIFVEAVWRRPDGTHVLDRAPDRGGLTFDACPTQNAGAEDLSTVTADGHATVESTDSERETPVPGHQVPGGAWLRLIAIAVWARQRF